MKVIKMDLKNTQLIQKRQKEEQTTEGKNKGKFLNKYHNGRT